MKQVTVIKVGGAIVEDAERLAQLLDRFAALPGQKVLVHGGGRRATKVASALGIESKMVEGRRITDADMLEVVTMVYGGLVNKNIVAQLQSRGVNAVGLTGRLLSLICDGLTPVMAPLTHDGMGHILNTNADTIAAETAKALAQEGAPTTLVYCFEKAGVLADPDDESSVIGTINHNEFVRLVANGTISGGMIPKITNALAAVDAGVDRVIITKAENIGKTAGTVITR